MKNQRIKTEKAAQLLELPVQTLRVFIQIGKFSEFATAIKKEGAKHWTYYINTTRLKHKRAYSDCHLNRLKSIQRY